MKQYVFITRAAQNRQSFYFLTTIYEQNAKTVDSVHYRILWKWSGIIANVLRGYMIVAVITCTAFFTLPFVVYWLNGCVEYEYMLYAFIPGIDERSRGGYILICCIHTFWLIIGCFGIGGSDVFFASLMFHVWPLSDIFAHNMRELNEMLAAAQTAPCITERKYKSVMAKACARMRNIQLMHKDITE